VQPTSKPTSEDGKRASYYVAFIEFCKKNFYVFIFGFLFVAFFFMFIYYRLIRKKRLDARIEKDRENAAEIEKTRMALLTEGFDVGGNRNCSKNIKEGEDLDECDYDSFKQKIVDSDDEVENAHEKEKRREKEKKMGKGKDAKVKNESEMKPPVGVIKKAKLDARLTILEALPPPPGRIKRAIREN